MTWEHPQMPSSRDSILVQAKEKGGGGKRKPLYNPKPVNTTRKQRIRFKEDLPACQPTTHPRSADWRIQPSMQLLNYKRRNITIFTITVMSFQTLNNRLIIIICSANGIYSSPQIIPIILNLFCQSVSML